MARGESFDAETATAALQQAITGNEELMEKFSEANRKVQNAYTVAGEALGGKLGIAASNAWGEDTGETFQKRVLDETERFFNEKVSNIIKEMQAYAEEANSTYNG